MTELCDLVVNEYVLKETDRLFPDVVLCRRPQWDGRMLWAICQGPYCFNMHGKWEYEPLPSSRTDSFTRRCRFLTAEKALRFWESRGHSIRWNGRE